MNVEFKELFGVEIPLIPLTEAGNIECGNATRIDWRKVCDPAAATDLRLRNPPYAGVHSMQDEARRRTSQRSSDGAYPRKYLDYIALWFFKGAEYVTAAPSAEARRSSLPTQSARAITWA